MALHSKSKPAQRPYEHQDYPSIRYRLLVDGSIEHCQVASADDEAQLGPGWVDSPAKCKAKPASPKPPAPPAKAPAPPKANGGDAPKPPAPPTPAGTTDPQ